MTKTESTISRIARTSTNLATIGSVAYKAFKVAKTVAALINVEKKFFDVPNVSVSQTMFNNAGSVGIYTAMAQGNDYNQRNGISIMPKSFQLNMNVYNTGTNFSTNRIIVFRDNENRQAIPTVSDVLETVTPQSPLNHVNGKRFRILKDWKFTLDGVSKQTRYIDYYHQFNKPGAKVKDHIRFEGSGAGVASADEGHIFILFISDNITANAPFGTLYTRLRYVDN